MKFIVGICLLLLSLLAPHAEAASGITYSGKLLKGDTVVDTGTVRFDIWIRTSSGCLLYYERHDIDMTGSDGTYAFEINGPGATNVQWGNATLITKMQDVFDNSKTFTAGQLTGTGCGAFTPAYDEERLMAVTFTPPGDTAQALPDLTLTAVPSAFQAYNANKLNGYDQAHMLRVDPTVASPTNPDMSAANLAEFVRLVTHPNSAYLTSAATLTGDVSGTLSATSVDKIKGYAVTAPAGAADDGKVLTFNSVTGWSLQTSSGSSGDSSYSAKGLVQFDTDAATSGITVTTGVAKVNVGTSAGQIVQVQTGGKLPALDGSSLTNVAVANASITSAKIASGTIVDANISSSAAIAWSKIASPTTLSGYGITDAVLNNGSVPSIASGLDIGLPVSGTTTGDLYVAYDSGKIYRWGGTTWGLVATKDGTATSGYVNGGNSYGGDATIGLSDAYSLGFKTNGATQMTLDSTGKLGIGTTSPANTLDVVGNEVIKSSSATALAVGPNGTTNPALTVNASAASSVTGVSIVSDAAGNGVSINATSSAPDETLSINSKGNGWLNIGAAGNINISQGLGSVNMALADGQFSLWRSYSTDSWTSPLISVGSPGAGSLAAGQEAPEALFDFGNIRNHLSNTNIPLQREFIINPSTHSFSNNGGSITTAATLAVNSPPIGGTNATIASSSAIYVPSTAITNVTNSYGLNVSASTGATNNYAAAFLGGNVGIGTATPQRVFHEQYNVTNWNDGFMLENLGDGGANLALKSSGSGGGHEYNIVSTGSGNSTGAGSLAVLDQTAGAFRLVLDPNGNFGINTKSPDLSLHVAGPLYDAGAFPFNVAIEDTANSAAGVGGGIVFTGNDGVYWNRYLSGIHGGKENGTAGDFGSFLAFHTRTNGWGSISERMRINSLGYVGINTSNPGYMLEVNGDTYTSGYFHSPNGTIQTSDIRFKRNVASIEDSLNKILDLRGVTYDWRSDEFPDRHFTDRHQMGVIAQEVEKQFPEAVVTGQDGYKAVNYSSLVAPLINAVKELYAKLTGYDERLQALEKENAELKARLDRLEKAQSTK